MRYGDCVAACGYHIERFFSARLGECGPVVETNPLGSVREVGLEDLEEFRSRIPHVCEGDVETIYQVWSDLHRVRKWTDLRVDKAGTVPERIILRGNPPRSDVKVVPPCKVVPVLAQQEIPFEALADMSAKEECGAVTLAIVDGDSTTAYYSLRDAENLQQFLSNSVVP